MSRREVILVLVLLGLVVNTQGQTTTETVLSDTIKNNKNQVTPETQKILTRLAHLPYGNDYMARKSTLGQLCKESSMVVVGQILTSRLISDDVKEDLGGDVISLALDVRTNLYGTVVQNPLSFRSHWVRDAPLPTVGTKVVVFLSDETYSPTNFTSSWAFDRAKTRGSKNETLMLLGKHRGVLTLEKQTEDVVLAAVTEYLHQLRFPGRDAKKYYAVLCQLSQSVVERISADAKIDLIHLFQHPVAGIDLNRVVEDRTVDELVRYYVEMVLLGKGMPSRESKGQ